MNHRGDFKMEQGGRESVNNWFTSEDDLAASPKAEFDEDNKFKMEFEEGEDPTCSSGQYQLQRKGEKKTFYCNLCKIPLSSIETMMSHKQGAKHTRKVIAKQEEVREAFYRNIISRDEEEEELNKEWILPVSNPESLKSKVSKALRNGGGADFLIF